MTVQLLLPGVLADLAGGHRELDVDADGRTLAELLDTVALQYPLLGRRIRDEAGRLRRFVNVYVDGDDVRFDQGLATVLKDGNQVHVLPSIAGG